jgi:hypothetical protein
VPSVVAIRAGAEIVPNALGVLWNGHMVGGSRHG